MFYRRLKPAAETGKCALSSRLGKCKRFHGVIILFSAFFWNVYFCFYVFTSFAGPLRNNSVILNEMWFCVFQSTNCLLIFFHLSIWSSERNGFATDVFSIISIRMLKFSRSFSGICPFTLLFKNLERNFFDHSYDSQSKKFVTIVVADNRFSLLLIFFWTLIIITSFLRWALVHHSKLSNINKRLKISFGSFRVVDIWRPLRFCIAVSTVISKSPEILL